MNTQEGKLDMNDEYTCQQYRKLARTAMNYNCYISYDIIDHQIDIYDDRHKLLGDISYSSLCRLWTIDVPKFNTGYAPKFQMVAEAMRWLHENVIQE
jgi:hypothetical protein